MVNDPTPEDIRDALARLRKTKNKPRDGNEYNTQKFECYMLFSQHYKTIECALERLQDGS